MRLLDLVARERTRRIENPDGWARVIVRTAEEEAALDAALADGTLRGNVIVRRIVEWPIRPAEHDHVTSHNHDSSP
jgi:hypothetical protein